MDGKAMDVVDPSLGKEYPTHEVLEMHSNWALMCARTSHRSANHA
jgi:hypothetical protein